MTLEQRAGPQECSDRHVVAIVGRLVVAPGDVDRLHRGAGVTALELHLRFGERMRRDT